MEHLLLLTKNIGLKDLVIGSVRLGDKLIAEDNQSRSSNDRGGHGDRESPFGSWKIGNKTSVDLGRNEYDKIGMKPSRTIGIPLPHITRTRMSNCNISNLVIRGSPWHATIKSES